jgi:hypothetical protein
VRLTPLFFFACAIRAIQLDQPIFVVAPIVLLRRFMSAWGSVTFDRNTACCMNCFGFFMRSYPPKIAKGVDDSRCYKQKGGRGGKYMPPTVRNGPVSTSVWLACALRYFAGGLPYDIMCKYGISEVSVRESTWVVVEAVNSLDEFIIEYPDLEEAQLKLASKF